MPATAPSTPEPGAHTTRRAAIMNRSFTVPPKLASTTRTTPTPEIGAAEGIETLYVHPSASIVKFTTSGLSRPSSSSGSPRAGDQANAGTLPWTSSMESTLAAGPMEIYRVPGSVSFLHSGALLHAILPRSQCWCVDGVSKFAFRVLPETYYRIELPGETSEDLEAVEALKATLSKVLFYERTPCPFARGFTVALPQDEVKVKKNRRISSGPAKKWRLDRAYSWKPEGREGEQAERSRSDSSSAGASEEEDSAETSQDESARKEAVRPAQKMPEAVPETPTKMPLRPPVSTRSVTAPVQLSLQSPPPSRLRSRVENDGTIEVVEEIPLHAGQSSQDNTRLRLYQAIPTDMPPSPPDSSIGAEARELGETELHDSDDEDETGTETTEPDAEQDPSSPQEDSVPSPPESSTPGSIAMRAVPPELSPDTISTRSSPVKYAVDSLPRSLADMPSTSDESASVVTSDAPSVEAPASSSQPKSSIRRPSSPEDPFAAIQARIQARRSIGGTASFLPRSNSPTRKSQSSTSSTATISSTLSQTRPSLTSQQRSLTTALVTKACAMFLGPPAHLVAIMLRIASRFANGTFGNVFLVESPAGSPLRVPGSYHIDEEESDLVEDLEDWEEDDFGVPLRSPVRLAGVRERSGWELD